MQAIIDSLPEHVLNFKDVNGKTILDRGFTPFAATYRYDSDFTKLRKNDFFEIIRPYYTVEETKKGKKITVFTGNIQEAIDNEKIKNIKISNEGHAYINSYEDDVYRILDAKTIQRLYLKNVLKSNGKQYHVDFMLNVPIGTNITSYYNYGRETAKTVALRDPRGPVTNNLISLGRSDTKCEPYPDIITSKFIKYTNYTNARDHLVNPDIIKILEEAMKKIKEL